MTVLIHNALTRFIVQVLLILGVSRGLGLLMRRMGQPLVVAEVLAGILLGPSLLGWLFPGISLAVFSGESLPILKIVSQLGLILFMFLVGLELDPASLRGHGRAAVMISQSSIVVPFALGAGLAWWLHGRWSPPGVPLVSFMLFLGASMSITAFPVLARIMAEGRLLHTRLGNIAVTVAAFNDITAWCILAFVVAIARAEALMLALITTALSLVYILGMWLLVRPFLRRLAAQAQTRAGLTQGKVALVLAMLLVSAWATELIGIHALFGAFLFGTILPKDGELAHGLAGKIEDLVLVLLLPLFFAYSGLRTQIGLLDTSEAWWTCVLIVMVASVGKFGGGALPAWLSGLSWREASALGILINTRGLIELIVLNIGLDLGVISPAVFTMMVLMALVTTFMTSPILQWVYPKEQIARELLAEPRPAPAPAAPSGYAVLMCVSFARSGPGLLRIADALTGHDAGRRLYALSLVAPPDRESYFLSGGEADAPAGEGVLTPLLELARNLGQPVRPLSFVSATPAQDIANVASVQAADLILLGWHKPLVGQALLGGTVYEIMQRAPADVAVLVERQSGALRRILLPYQGSPNDLAALRLVRRLMRSTGATATILHVVPPESATFRQSQAQLDVRQVFTGSGESVELKVVPHGTPAEAALAETRQGYDLVVIGIGEKWGLRERAIGFQPDLLIRDCPVSLLIVRTPSAPRTHAAPAVDMPPLGAAAGVERSE